MHRYRYSYRPNFPTGATVQATSVFATILLVICSAILILRPALAEGPSTSATLDLAVIFPGADRMGEMSGEIPSAPVYRNDEIVGYVFSTLDTVGTIGFSGKPINIMVGMNLGGDITGAQIIHHSEPILIIGVSPASLEAFVRKFSGINVSMVLKDKTETPADETAMPDAVTGASISSAVIADGIIRAGRAVARTRNLFDDSASAYLNRDVFEVSDWSSLIADGSIVRTAYSQRVVEKNFAAQGWTLVEITESDDPFIDVSLALLSPARIGQNLLGKQAFNRLLRKLGPNDHLLLAAANGRYSFKGTNWIRSDHFDRLQLVQDKRTISFVKDQHTNVERLSPTDAPEFREIAVFTIPENSGFDSLKPWRIDIRVQRDIVQGGQASILLPFSYALPGSYIVTPQAMPGEGVDILRATDQTILWESIWRDYTGRIIVLGILLAILTTVLIFQDLIVHHVRRYHIFRNCFLAFVVIWLGWYAGGQLSVVNVLTFIHALMSNFTWSYFLLDPLMFILWGYVAIAMLFWGRGVFCGWLCPFGALQELINTLARQFPIPQLTLPWGLHERFWPIKYILFIGLFAVSLTDIALAMNFAESEPFKTAITLRFLREWPYVSFAFALLFASAFIDRFYCRYLCALGAALAIPARLRMFEWLKRRHQCGSECDVCAKRCTVQAIHPTGQINPNECIYCLECQTVYFDDHLCPPLSALRKKRERRKALAEASVNVEAANAGSMPS